MTNLARHQPRAPKGIRRHYDNTETNCTRLLPPPDSASILHRPLAGTSIKQARLAGTRLDNPGRRRDGSWKYIAQAISLPHASRNGQPWEPWENDYLLRNAHTEDLLHKALVLKRTYRAVESQRRDLLRHLDSPSPLF